MCIFLLLLTNQVLAKKAAVLDLKLMILSICYLCTYFNQVNDGSGNCVNCSSGKIFDNGTNTNVTCATLLMVDQAGIC